MGSVEANCDSLVKLLTDEVKVKIIGSWRGGITETDAPACCGFQRIILGFKRACRRFCAPCHRLREHRPALLTPSSMTYRRSESGHMTGMLRQSFKQQIIGLAEVRGRLQVAEVWRGCRLYGD
jgi:translation initiation factor IF-2